MISTSLFYYAALATAATASVCPILGPVFPTPQDLGSSAAFQDALKTIHSRIDEAFATGNTTHGRVNPNDTYTIQVFSTAQDKPLFEYYRRGSTVLGNSTVDGDSIFRIASTSKLVTVYLLLLEAGEAVFNEKVTKYLPELADIPYWDDMTVGSLAGYLGGVTADLFDTTALPGGDLNVNYPGAFPPLAANEISECKYGSGGCTREVFLRTLKNRRPVYQPNTTPAYSNVAFATLGLILEGVANSTFGESLQKRLLTPLHLTSTSLSQPSNSSKGVIPADAYVSGWDLDLTATPAAAMGGLFSSPNDLTAIGRSILASTLLSPATTRAWLKPTSHTSSLIGAVGRPWEIYRAVTSTENNRVVDMYTKGGNLPGYGANLILIPDLDIGLTFLTASDLRSTVGSTIAGVIIDELLPALDEAARVEADAALAGTYTATNGLNSSVTLSTTPGLPGVTIDKWISNGTELAFVAPGEKFQMFPTNVVSDDGKKVSWRSTYFNLPDTGSPFDACPSWGVIDRPTWGIYGLDEFVFHIGEDGKAWGVEPKALKIVLEKA